MISPYFFISFSWLISVVLSLLKLLASVESFFVLEVIVQLFGLFEAHSDDGIFALRPLSQTDVLPVRCFLAFV